MKDKSRSTAYMIFYMWRCRLSKNRVCLAIQPHEIASSLGILNVRPNYLTSVFVLALVIALETTFHSNGTHFSNLGQVNSSSWKTYCLDQEQSRSRLVWGCAPCHASQ